MNKRVKWGIIIVIGAGLIGGGIYSQLPKENEELAAADKVMTGQRSGKKILNVNAKIIKPQLLKDEIQISGSLLPDEEVDLSFETSGKIIEINFEEGSFVKKGQLLAKVNDRPLQAQLQRLVSQLKDKLPNLSEEEKLALLASNGMLVKRPILVLEDKVLVGFKEAEWVEALKL